MRSLHAGDPERIGAYRLLGRLGEGGMGCVYLAQSPRGRTVAVKLVRHDLAEHSEFRRRFEQEVSAARRVGGEWTAPVLDADTDAAQPWVATGYIPGVSLQEAVAGRAAGGVALPERTLRILANRLALALRAVHEAGLIHRDVKPSNILITIDGPRVIDFGIARALETVADSQLTRTGAVVGSPGFMSPEQVRGERLTTASDIFSLGSVLGFAATGATPFESENNAGHVLMYRISQEEPDLDGIPDGLRGLIADCLAKEPGERPSLAALLERTSDPGDGPGPTSTSTDITDPWLPAGLVAYLGRHAARLLDAEVPGAQEAADRAAEAPAVPPHPSPPPEGGSRAPEETPTATSAHTPPGADIPPGGGREAPGTPPPSTPPPAPPYAFAPGPPHGTQVGAATVSPRQEPEPARGRRGRRTTVLVAAGVALALVAGAGTFVALRVLGSSGDGRSGSAEAGASRGGGTDKNGEASPARDGVLPKKYLGAWQGTVRDNGESVTRRFEIRQGKEGEVVASTVNLRKNLMCVGEATLVSFGGNMRVTSRITQAYPKSKSCSPYGEQDLRVTDDGRLSWRYPEGGLTAVLNRVGGKVDSPVPKGVLGRWKGHPDGEKQHARVLTFRQGAVGKATMRNVGDGPDYHCEWTYVLGAAEGNTLTYGPSDTDAATSRGAACDGEPASLVVSLEAGQIRIRDVEKPGDPPRVYERAR